MANGVSTLSVPNHIAAQPTVAHREPTTLLPVGSGFVADAENRLLAAVMQSYLATLADGSTDIHSPAWQRLTSPLVLVGATGSGKTHLAAGLADRGGRSRARYTTANDLRRDFAAAINQQQATAWRDETASVPLLVIDGVDHLPARNNFQYELLHVARELDARGHKLVVTARRPIGHVVGWLPELVNWFSSGLTLEIAPLGPASRRTLLLHHAERHGWQFTPDALDCLVAHASAEPRELLQLIADIERQFGKRASFALDTLDHFLRRRKANHAPQLSEIVRLVARYYQLPLKLLTSGSRKAEVVAARATAIYLARSLTSASYEQIGRLLGGRDHTTVMHSHRRIEQRLSHDPVLRSAVDELTRIVRR